MARRVAADLTDPDVEDDDLDTRAPAQAGGDPPDDPDDTDDEADEDVPEDEEVDPAEQEGAPAARRVRTRERDDGDLAAQLSAERDRAAAAERRAAEAETRWNASQQTQGETPEQEAARTALMTPEQLIDYKVNKALGNHQRTTQQMVLSASNTADKASFDAMAHDNPVVKKVSAEVERKHAELVAKGQYPTRETVLKYVLGEQALKMATQTRAEGRERTRRVERERTRPLANRSEVGAQPRRNSGKTAEDRLDGVLL